MVGSGGGGWIGGAQNNEKSNKTRMHMHMHKCLHKHKHAVQITMRMPNNY